MIAIHGDPRGRHQGSGRTPCRISRYRPARDRARLCPERRHAIFV